MEASRVGGGEGMRRVHHDIYRAKWLQHGNKHAITRGRYQLNITIKVSFTH